MAPSATLHHLTIALSDTDRGVYESLDLRIARHPSETMRYLLARTIALCLLWEEGILFSKGLSTVEEPAVWIREPDGRVKLWVDVGAPSAERMHKASKHAERVVVVTYPDATAVKRNADGAKIHRAEHVEVMALDTAFLDALERVVPQRGAIELVHTGGRLYVTAGGETVEGDVTRTMLAPD
ncbi:MAG TPA: YaeQ family protein [Polyangiaceae bacterium]|nr:YaeQ family protein [Polyangiaceae bacterium]